MRRRFSLCLVLGILLAPIARGADALETADQAATSWIKLQMETARSESEWKSQREILESLIVATNERAAMLEDKRDLAKAKSAKDREEIADLDAKTRAATADLKSVEIRLTTLTAKLLALRPQLPPQLSNALEMSYRSLGDNKLSVSERAQVAFNVLNRCAQFNRIISVGEDVLTLEGEPSAKSFEVIYWGLSRGYAIDRPGHKAWLGSPGPRGWTWEARPGAFDHIVQLIAVSNGKVDPEFVSAPARIVREVATQPEKTRP